MGVIFTEGIFILIYRLQSAKRIRIPKPPFLPTCCSSTAAPIFSSFRMNRRLSRRNQSSCGGRCMFWRWRSAQCRCAIWRYQGPAIEPGRAPNLFNYIFIVLIYVIYIYWYCPVRLIILVAFTRKNRIILYLFYILIVKSIGIHCNKNKFKILKENN